MKARAMWWLATCASISLAPAISAQGVRAQQVYTDLPAGLTVSQVLRASGLPIDSGDPDGWSSGAGGAHQGPNAVPVHYSLHESVIRVPGVRVDTVRSTLERTLRAELAARGLRLLERPEPPRPPGAPVSPRDRGEEHAWTAPWRVPGSGSGWITMLVTAAGPDRVRLVVVSVEVREAR